MLKTGNTISLQCNYRKWRFIFGVSSHTVLSRNEMSTLSVSVLPARYGSGLSVPFTDSLSSEFEVERLKLISCSSYNFEISVS